MARPLDGIAAKDVKVSLRLTKAEAAALDKQRGSLSRTTYLRQLIVKDSPRARP